MNICSRKVVTTLLLLCGGQMLMAAPVPSPRKINARTPQLLLLDRDWIPQAERRSWQPAELVAILGNQCGRHWKSIIGISYSQDGKRIATLGGRSINGSSVYIWEADRLRFQGFLPIQATFVQFVAGRDTLLTCSTDATVRLWVLSGAKYKERVILRKPFGAFDLYNMAVSPDGKKLLARTSRVGTDADADIYDLTASAPKRSTIPLEKDQSLYVATFSPDSRTLATLTCKVQSCREWGWPCTTTDHQVSLWDVSGPKPMKRVMLTGVSRPRGVLTFSPDGKTVICGGSLWDLSEAKPTFRGTVIGQEEEVWGCVFSSNGQRVITTSAKDNRLYVRVWDMREPHTADRANRAALRSLLRRSRPGSRRPDGRCGRGELLAFMAHKIRKDSSNASFLRPYARHQRAVFWGLRKLTRYQRHGRGLASVGFGRSEAAPTT